MKKLLVLSLIFVLCTLPLAACGSPTAAPTAVPQKATEAPPTAVPELSGTLVVAFESWMIDKYNAHELGARFEADHPGVTV